MNILESKTRYLVILLLALGSTTPAEAIDVWNYWLMPHGLVGHTDNLTWGGDVLPGEHCFWRGTMLGRTVALQGDPSFKQYDIFVENGSVLEYWGTFRGNDVTHPDSHSFDAPFRWMNSSMVVGQAIEHAVTTRVMDSEKRKVTSSGTGTLRLELNAHYPSWTIPETGVSYQDVIKITYFPDKNQPSLREVYHLARGKGFIYFESFVVSELNSIHKVWVTSFSTKSFQNPTIPWFDPFFTYPRIGTKSAVLNGLFEDRTSSVQGARINDALPSWSASSADGVITTDAPLVPKAGAWQICLRGLAGGGDGTGDAATSTWIPVFGGKTYRLSGWAWRGSTSDNVYLDFNDGSAQGASFPDVQALATTINAWQFLQATVTLPAATTYIKVRTIRDGSNLQNAYFDGITLQRLN